MFVRFLPPRLPSGPGNYVIKLLLVTPVKVGIGNVYFSFNFSVHLHISKSNS